MVGDKAVCQRRCVTKLCVKDRVCVCVKVVREREGMTKLCVKDGVSQKRPKRATRASPVP